MSSYCYFHIYSAQSVEAGSTFTGIKGTDTVLYEAIMKLRPDGNGSVMYS